MICERTILAGLDVSELPREITEAALAHVIGDKAQKAYRRSDALEKPPSITVGRKSRVISHVADGLGCVKNAVAPRSPRMIIPPSVVSGRRTSWACSLQLISGKLFLASSIVLSFYTARVIRVIRLRSIISGLPQ